MAVATSLKRNVKRLEPIYDRMSQVSINKDLDAAHERMLAKHIGAYMELAKHDSN